MQQRRLCVRMHRNSATQNRAGTSADDVSLDFFTQLNGLEFFQIKYRHCFIYDKGTAFLYAKMSRSSGTVLHFQRRSLDAVKALEVYRLESLARGKACFPRVFWTTQFTTSSLYFPEK